MHYPARKTFFTIDALSSEFDDQRAIGSPWPRSGEPVIS
jgi:hypothetical protein